MKKKPKYFIQNLGDGRYHAVWQEGRMLNECYFTDQYEVEMFRQMKNPYKHNKFPMVIINWEERLKEGRG